MVQRKGLAHGAIEVGDELFNFGAQIFLAGEIAATEDTDGFETWPVGCIEQYRTRHKLGTRARLALELLCSSMQRRGDIVRLGQQRFRRDTLALPTEDRGTSRYPGAA
jgi:hypothetical protein